eukprot:TRINITY_DN62535_c0_g1_i1.p1 TRINITY_DN62535_c0_g1~~TRINITY_DN62535_c0_g1_i1.p1  ORF type:complete len:197 (+),score=64.59 TRINITY_DN62535_c0_g1_i1:82-591(+)
MARASGGGLFSIWIVNKSGGLIFDKDFGQEAQGRPAAESGRGRQGGRAMDVNLKLKVAGIFHGLHAISKQMSPVADSGGIEMIEADSYKFFCFESYSRNIKIFCTTDPSVNNRDANEFMQEVYKNYADYVLKNPFYEVDQYGIGQPIRLSLWERKLMELVAEKRLMPHP